MKRCQTCKTEKLLSEFNVASKAKDGLQARCKSCFKAAYVADKPAQIARVTARNLKHKIELKAYVSELKKSPCTDCNISYHPFVMDWDHVRGTKLKDISELVRSAVSWAKLKEELTKCELVCSNCHRLRTGKRSGMIDS